MEDHPYLDDIVLPMWVCDLYGGVSLDVMWLYYFIKNEGTQDLNLDHRDWTVRYTDQLYYTFYHNRSILQNVL